MGLAQPTGTHSSIVASVGLRPNNIICNSNYDLQLLVILIGPWIGGS